MHAKPSEIVDYLVYSSYRANRKLSPKVTPQEWEAIFGAQTAALEVRFYLEEHAPIPIRDEEPVLACLLCGTIAEDCPHLWHKRTAHQPVDAALDEARP